MTAEELKILGCVLCVLGILIQLGFQPLLHYLKKNLFE